MTEEQFSAFLWCKKATTGQCSSVTRMDTRLSAIQKPRETWAPPPLIYNSGQYEICVASASCVPRTSHCMLVDSPAAPSSTFSYTMKAVIALFLLTTVVTSVLGDVDDDLGTLYEGVDVRCLFDEVLCWDLHTVCLDKPNLRLKEKIRCDVERKECIDGLPNDCRNMFRDIKATSPKPIS
ncbi:hypothetical protein Btru_038039 [Bulinus truncatus]|nr:hypothetical protein Btru_038039 [Bulinus truncatus]